MPSAVSIDDIRAARERIRDVVYQSPCPDSMTLSRLCGGAGGASVYCKFEHLQMTGSFKERGARNKLLLLAEQSKGAGVGGWWRRRRGTTRWRSRGTGATCASP
jgi:threonine dehydratase